jgi:hypothetical protein
MRDSDAPEEEQQAQRVLRHVNRGRQHVNPLVVFRQLEDPEHAREPQDPKHAEGAAR